MQSPSYSTASHHPDAGVDHPSTYMHELGSARMNKTELADVSPTSTVQVKRHVERSLTLSARSTSARAQSLVGRRLPSPISPLHLGPPTPSPLLAHSKLYGAPTAPYLPPRRFGTVQSTSRSTMSEEPDFFRSSRATSPDYRGNVRLYRHSEEAKSPKASLYPFCGIDRTGYFSALPAAGPSSIPMPGRAHSPARPRLPPFSVAMNQLEDLEDPRPLRYRTMSPPLLAPPTSEPPYLLEAQTMEAQLSLQDLITLAIKRGLPLRTIIIDRLHRTYSSAVPVYPDEVQEFEYPFGGLDQEYRGSTPRRLSRVYPKTPCPAPRRELSGSPQARSEARAADRRAGRMDLGFITHGPSISRLPDVPEYPEALDNVEGRQAPPTASPPRSELNILMDVQRGDLGEAEALVIPKVAVVVVTHEMSDFGNIDGTGERWTVV
ncbi:hypothetical protein NP233_g3298 [Leucocoprinus birnbaumii]|uniref:Uncharacterized protein n=1 Tax=Leucocoprinus birnbaumii TaxID=56174 RepID=A0AAD5W0K6_9AGAR|nr:hypothetical protein NP233_g3298 [Leucocoprinus birnbaumii]